MFGMKKIACLTRKVEELEIELITTKNALKYAEKEMDVAHQQLTDANAEKKKIAIRLREQTNADIAYLAFKAMGGIPSEDTTDVKKNESRLNYLLKQQRSARNCIDSAYISQQSIGRGPFDNIIGLF